MFDEAIHKVNHDIDEDFCMRIFQQLLYQVKGEPFETEWVNEGESWHKIGINPPGLVKNLLQNTLKFAGFNDELEIRRDRKKRDLLLKVFDSV